MSGYRTIGGGTSGEGGTGRLRIGPEYGGDAPYHPAAKAAIDLFRVDPAAEKARIAAALAGSAQLTGFDTDPEAAVDLASVDPEMGTAARAAIDLFRVDPTAKSVQTAAAISADYELDGFSVAAMPATTLQALDPTTAAGAAGGIDLVSIDNDYGSGMQVAGDWQALAALGLKISPVLLPSDDTFADEGAAGSNFGTNVDVNIRGADIFGNDEEIGYLLFDLRPFAGFVSENGADFTFTTNVVNGDSGTLTCGFHAFDTKPFDEGTLTWNNQPSTNLQFSETVAVSGGALSDYTIPISASNLDLLLGKWAMLRFTSNIRNRAGMTSTDDPDTTQHPQLENMTLVPA